MKFFCSQCCSSHNSLDSDGVRERMRWQLIDAEGKHRRLTCAPRYQCAQRPKHHSALRSGE